MNCRCLVVALGVAALAAPVAAKHGPAMVFAAYVKAVNAGDVHAVEALVAADARMQQRGICPPSASARACLIDYLEKTVVERHSTITPLHVSVDGDTALAKLELRSDLTRAAGIERLAGTDRVKTANGKIVEFDFARDDNDPQTVKFFEFMKNATRPGEQRDR